MSFGVSINDILVDSLVVTFDKKYAITHYKNDSISLNSEGYLYHADSLRNIFNPSSYEVKQVSQSKHTRNWIFTYTFTEEDYQDAKKRGGKVK